MPVEPPPKKEQLQKLLERGNVFLHLDPRVEGVVVPTWHAQKPQLVLQLGLHFAVPIPDLKIDDRGVRCTLSFNRSPFFCDLPWVAVYAMVAEDGQVTVWPTELPPELVPQASPVRRAPPTSRSARGRSSNAAESGVEDSDAPPVAEKPRPRIAAVPSTRAPKLAPVTPIKPAPAPVPVPATAEDAEHPPDDPSPATPGDRKSGRERPAWLRVVK